MQDQIPNLIVQCTLACPLECAHCITDSGPYRNERISPSSLFDIIEESARLGMSRIGFTGGDPFLLKGELADCLRLAHKLGLGTVVVTSAYWATSQKAALRTLEPCRDVGFLGLSADSYHAPYVPLSRIRNALWAARELQIHKVELQVTGTDSREVSQIRAELGVLGAQLPIRFQKLWPVGRARDAYSETRPNGEVSIDDLDLSCPMGAPFLMTTGKVVGCCSAITRLGDENPLILGDTNISTLGEILRERKRNSHYMFLKNFGLKPFVELLRRQGKLKTEHKSATDVCHLCHELHSDPEIRNILVTSSVL